MKTSIRIIQWIPRVLGILAILFISMFALDSFEPGMPFLQQIEGFLIHMIPSLILGVFLFVAWKWELIGGIMFVIIGLGLLPVIYMMNYQMNHSVWTSLSVVLVINFPFIVVGILFIILHFLKIKNHE
ncbi:MAG: DUF7670 domain-containing protein [Bacteroidales bacterium]